MYILGQCSCREGFTGIKCDYCAAGSYGYPNCQKCGCDVSGTVLSDGGLLECDDKGQCPCKNLVTGLKCDQCRQATFGLSTTNPDGCTRCFCFGRSQDCQQSEMAWGQARLLGPRNVSIQYITNYRSQRYFILRNLFM